MKKILVILAFALIPSFLYAVMSGTVPVNVSMHIRQSIGISVTSGIQFPTQSSGTTPSSVASNGTTGVPGGVNGVDGSVTVTGEFLNQFVLGVCQVGSSGCLGTSGNSGTGGSGRLNNGTSYYDVSYTSMNGNNWSALFFPDGPNVPGGPGVRVVQIRGTISATGNPFTAGAYNGTALVSVIYESELP